MSPCDDQVDVDQFWMRQALQLAEQAEKLGEGPVGAVAIYAGELIGEGFNQPISARDATAHAEVIALRNAGQHMENYRLPGVTLYVTLEPCTMCAGALVHARVARLVYGATEPKAGVVVSHPLLESTWLNHRVVVTGGVLADECSAMLSDFFAQRRSSA